MVRKQRSDAAFVAYYRVSTVKQGIDGNGMAAQRAAVEAYAKRREHEGRSPPSPDCHVVFCP